MLLTEQVWVLTGAAGKVGSVLRKGPRPLVGSLRLSTWLSPWDTVAAFHAAMSAPDITFRSRAVFARY